MTVAPPSWRAPERRRASLNQWHRFDPPAFRAYRTGLIAGCEPSWNMFLEHGLAWGEFLPGGSVAYYNQRMKPWGLWLCQTLGWVVVNRVSVYLGVTLPSSRPQKYSKLVWCGKTTPGRTVDLKDHVACWCPNYIHYHYKLKYTPLINSVAVVLKHMPTSLFVIISFKENNYNVKTYNVSFACCKQKNGCNLKGYKMQPFGSIHKNVNKNKPVATSINNIKPRKNR